MQSLPLSLLVRASKGANYRSTNTGAEDGEGREAGLSLAHPLNVLSLLLFLSLCGRRSGPPFAVQSGAGT